MLYILHIFLIYFEYSDMNIIPYYHVMWCHYSAHTSGIGHSMPDWGRLLIGRVVALSHRSEIGHSMPVDVVGLTLDII